MLLKPLMAVVCLCISNLKVYELILYISLQMSVDLKRGETLPIHINMTFPSLPCDG